MDAMVASLDYKRLSDDLEQGRFCKKAKRQEWKELGEGASRVALSEKFYTAYPNLDRHIVDLAIDFEIEMSKKYGEDYSAEERADEIFDGYSDKPYPAEKPDVPPPYTQAQVEGLEVRQLPIESTDAVIIEEEGEEGEDQDEEDEEEIDEDSPVPDPSKPAVEL